MAMLTSEFDFQRVISYKCSIVTIALKCAVFDLGSWDGRIDGRIIRSTA